MRCRLLWLIIGFILVCGSVGAEKPAAPTGEPEKVTVTTTVTPDEIRDYKVDLVASGNALPVGSTTPIDLSANLSAKIRHKYGRRAGDGLLLLEINLVEGQITMQDQKLEVTPSLYPKLSVLLDRNWQITDVYGLAGSSVAQSSPGFGYGNLIVLFYSLGAVQPRSVGEKWTTQVLDEAYEFTNTLKRVEIVDGVKAAIIQQNIIRKPVKTGSDNGDSMKATAESAFAIGDGKLLKTHVECEASSSTVKQAKVKLDIAYISAEKTGASK